MSDPHVLRRYRVEGRVQGVGFRAFVWREAQQIAVAGWVRNRLDGSVELLAEGSEGQHRILVDSLWRGPRWSRVDRVTWVEERAGEAFGPGFSIRRDG